MIDTAHLQENEIPVVRDIIDGRGLGRPFADLIAIKLYKEPEITKGGIYKAEITRENEEYNAVSGLVVGIGPDCFKTGKYEYSAEPGCKIGDWVVFSYKTPNRFKHRDVTLVYTYDDCILTKCDDPREIKRG